MTPIPSGANRSRRFQGAGRSRPRLKAVLGSAVLHAAIFALFAALTLFDTLQPEEPILVELV